MGLGLAEQNHLLERWRLLPPVRVRGDQQAGLGQQGQTREQCHAEEWVKLMQEASSGEEPSLMSLGEEPGAREQCHC